MATVLVPGVAQTVMRGTIVGNPWAMVFHWRFGTSTAPWATADLQTLCNTLMNAWKTNLQTHSCVPTVFSGCDAVDIGTATPNVATSTVAQFSGTGGGSALTAAASTLVNFKIASRYRGGHPRCYIPGTASADCVDGETITTGGQTGVTNGIAAVVSAVVTALPGSGGGAANHCVPRYTYTVTNDPLHNKYLRTRSGLIGVFTVQSYTCHPRLATQRRRLQTA